MIDLDELERLANAATPGPWFPGDARNPAWLYVCGHQYDKDSWQVGDMYGARIDDEESLANAKFVAAARTAVPELAARVRELELTRGTMLNSKAERDTYQAGYEAAREQVLAICKERLRYSHHVAKLVRAMQPEVKK